MEKIIKKWGDSFVVIISPDDMRINNLKEGDILDMEICKKEWYTQVKIKDIINAKNVAEWYPFRKNYAEVVRIN